MKKIVSTLLAAAMLLSSFMALGAFADNETIKAYNANGVYINTYSTIDAAANAAGVNGTVRLSAGTFEFNGRQTIAVEGVTLEGAGRGQTFIKTSSSYQYGSDTNKKALLTIAANNVKVKDLSIDASVYGDTITSETDFIVVRINSGTGIELNNVYVTGSPRTLIKLGSSSGNAAVTADNLYCDAEYKAIPSALDDGTYSNVYADIDINSGSSLRLNSGAVNGFIKKESGGSFANYAYSNHFRLVRSFIFVNLIDVTTTTKHFVNSYISVKSDPNYSSNVGTFKAVVNENDAVIRLMTDETILAGDQNLIDNFIELLNDVLATYTNETLTECRNDLIAA